MSSEPEDPFAHIQVSESHDSRSTSRSPDDAQCRQFFSVTGALSSAEAEARIRAQAKPPEVTYSANVSYDVQPVFFDRNNTANNIFEVSRTYSKKQGNNESDENGISWTFSASSSTATCTEARRAIAAPGSYQFWNDPPENEQPEGYQPGQGSPINVRKVNGVLETGGVEITVSSLKLDMSFECTTVEWQLLKNGVIRKCNMQNSDVFFDWQPSELLFTDFTVSNQTPEIISVSYSFQVSPREDYIAGDFKIENAEGWAVKWSYWGDTEEIEIEDAEGTKTKQIRPKCSGCYASSPYLRTMFSSLLPPRLQQ